MSPMPQSLDHRTRLLASDELLEQAIEAAYQALVEATDRTSRRLAAGRMTILVRARSADQVLRMEQALELK